MKDKYPRKFIVLVICVLKIVKNGMDLNQLQGEIEEYVAESKITTTVE